MSGTVNISRGIWHDVAFKPQPFTEREAWMWMIMEASYKARQKRVGNITVDLERGQLATSIRFMCDAWSWSKSTVDRFLKRLEKRDMIGTDSGTGINVITISKYDDYQNKPKDSGTPPAKKRDSGGTAAGQQRDKPNKGLIPDEIPEATSSQEAAKYQDYLKAHPNPVVSDAGYGFFSELVSDGTDPSQIIAAAKAYADTVKGWSGDAKVQQSDNFLDPERGQWRKYIPKSKPQASDDEILAFYAETVLSKKRSAASTVTSDMANRLIAANLVTPSQLQAAGVSR